MRALLIVFATKIVRKCKTENWKGQIRRAYFGSNFWREKTMRKTLTIALGALLIIGFTGIADAKSQKACDIGCSKYTGGQRGSIYTKCMAKCVQR